MCNFCNQKKKQTARAFWVVCPFSNSPPHYAWYSQ